MKIWERIGGGIVIVTLLIVALLIAAALSSRPPDSPLPTSPLSSPLNLSSPLAVSDGSFSWIVYLPLVTRSPVRPVLINPGFEEGVYPFTPDDPGDDRCSWYDSEDGHHAHCFVEQSVPIGWWFGWYEHYGAGLCESGQTGRPEANLSDRRHPGDVYADNFSAHGFVWGRCAYFWFLQYVVVTPGRYRASAQVRTWPGNPYMQAQICVNATCSPWVNTNGSWVKIEREATVSGQVAIVEVRCRAERPNAINNDCWVDGVSFGQIYSVTTE